MDDSGLESRFLAAMTEVARNVLQPKGRRTYDIVMEDTNQFIDEFIDCSHGGGAYVLWMEISDLYDDPRGPMSEELCEKVGRRAAAEWMSVDQSSPEEVSLFFARWHTPEPWESH